MKMNKTVLDDLIVGRVEPHIYAFTTNTVPNYLKVGETYRPVDVRLDEWRKHFPHLKREFDDSAKIGEVFFRDYSVHAYLEATAKRARLARGTFPSVYYSNEFFEGATRGDVKAAIGDIHHDFETKGQRYQFYSVAEGLPTSVKFPSTGMWPLRPNQDAAVKKFRAAVAAGRKNLLMYAVMRFGKSFTSMCCAQAMNGGKGARLVVVVSAKADVCDEWRRTVESAENFRNDYEFFSARDLKYKPEVVSEHIHKTHKKAVVFLTLQDLQTKTIKDKHRYLFKEKIDLLLVDETHYGARAGRYGEILRNTKGYELDEPSKRDDEDADNETKVREAIKAFKVDVTLHLSGTPYRILMGSEFDPKDIIAFCQFTDIVQEQQRWIKDNNALHEDEQKEEWENPYFGFPQMIRFAFHPNKSTRERLESLKKGGMMYAFSALFAPESITPDEKCGKHRMFRFEKEILDLFRVIDGSKHDETLLGFLDYDKIKTGKMCQHIVCVLPYCASCDALAALLEKERKTFKNLGAFKVLNISGHDMPKEYAHVECVRQTIAAAAKAHEKTLTLTVNRMLTGSTVPEWDTMLYFKDTSSPQEYDQAIFRLQNQYVIEYVNKEAGKTIKFNNKPQTLLVDFDPNRLFRMQETKSKIYNVNEDKAGNTKLRARIEEELVISPVVWMDDTGKLAQVTAANVMDAVSEYSRNRGVSAEAREMDADLTALYKSDKLLEAIMRENPIDDSNGLTIDPHKGEGGDLKLPPDIETLLKKAGKSGDPTGENVPLTNEEDKKRKEIMRRFRSYCSRILFFAFLTEDEVKSIEDIINVIGKGDNPRIARHIGIEKTVLKEILKYFDRFILSSLDYKIANMSRLSHDTELDAVKRAAVAIKKFDRLGPSEIMTPGIVADDMVALIPANELIRIAKSGEKILDISGKAGEFAYALWKRYQKIDPKLDVSNIILTIPTSGHAYEFTRKVYQALGLNTDNIALKFTAYDLLGVTTKDGAIDYNRIRMLLVQQKPFNEITMKDKTNSSANLLTIAAVVGNPPYQIEVAKKKSATNGQSRKRSIFQEFQIIADTVSSSVESLIYPGGRWIHRSGKGMETFGLHQINDTRLSRVIFYPISKDVFETAVAIADGISIVYKDINKKKSGFVYSYSKKGEVDDFTLDNPGESLIPLNPTDGPILQKVSEVCGNRGYAYLSGRILSQKLFGVESEFVEMNPSKVRLYCDGESVDYTRKIKLFTNHKAGKAGRAKWFVVNRDVIEVNQRYIDEWQVVVSSANAGGQKRDWQIELIDNHSAFGRSRVGLGSFKTKSEAKNFYRYCTSFLVRFLFLMTDESLTSLAKYVPDLKDYSNSNGLIDYAGDVNTQLYQMFGLSDSEIRYVEKTITDIDASRAQNVNQEE